MVSYEDGLVGEMIELEREVISLKKENKSLRLILGCVLGLGFGFLIAVLW
tara:strand:+ start:460 stop:609 length:150 start_codon:yes stop_codon:yes gene_type:complete